MAATGVQVNALTTYVETLSIDEFYYRMYTHCGADFMATHTYCSLFDMSSAETLEALHILSLIHSKV
jgi:hypothetical protein